jgi:hypothetical protein
MSEIDFLLRRDILDGSKYDDLIPESNCEVTNLGEGMTDYSVKKMAEWVQLKAWHMQKVAPLLKRSSLKKTCEAIHEWLYDHFQYKADEEDQQLYAPACAWAQRYNGIDCKSYSIIASSILVNLGINHYIRRIKQPGWNPDMWTHVYVIVPVDQQTASLESGYYVIDGTIDEEKEPLYTTKDDTFMSGLQHYGLGGVQPGLNGGLSIDSIKNLIGGNILGNLSCIGGVYTSASINTTVGLLVPWFSNMFNQINAAVAANQSNVIDLINKLLTNTGQIYDHSAYTASKNWDSACSKSATKGYAAIGKYYNDVVNQAFLGWLQTYFDVSYGTATVQNNTFEPETSSKPGGEGKYGMKKPEFKRNCTVKTVTSLTLKTTPNMQVKAFELTSFVADPATYNTGGFNISKAIEGFTTVLAAFNSTPTPTTTIPAGGTKTGTTTIDTEDLTTDAATPTNAGGGILAVVLLAAGAYFVFSGGQKKAMATAKTTTAKRKK